MIVYTIIQYGTLAIIFVLLYIGFYNLYKSLRMQNFIRNNVDKIYSQLSERDEIRIRELELERRKYGNVKEKKGLLERVFEKLDRLLRYSGWSIKHPALNTSSYIALNVCGCSIIFLISLFLSQNILLSSFLVLIVILIPILWMIYLCDRNYKLVENQLLIFVNMISSFSVSTNNLLDVLDDVAPHVGEPLRSSIQRAISVSNMEGDRSECVRVLSREIEHPLFNRYLRTLEVCADSSSDYASISRSYAPQIERFVRAAGRRRAIFANGRISMIAEILLGILMSVFSCNIVGSGESFISIIQDMMINPLGVVILVVEFIVYFSAILYIIFGMRR